MNAFTIRPVSETKTRIVESSLHPWFYDTFLDLEYASIHMPGPFGQFYFPRKKRESHKLIAQISREERIVSSTVLVENMEFERYLTSSK